MNVLIEKEIIRPGTYWYRDQVSDQPRKLVVTPELTKYWHEQGGSMLSSGLTVPVPCEHDFNAHPMSPADKLVNNAGWVKEYRLKNIVDPKTKKEHKDVLFGVVDVLDEALAKKLPRTIRWTSPWINSFVDGAGKQWNNVISHLALTTRPRIVEQEPFGSVAAALSIATEGPLSYYGRQAYRNADEKGFCLSRAGLLLEDQNKHLQPQYPLAFSMWAGGIKFDVSDMSPMPTKKKKPLAKQQVPAVERPEDDDDNDGISNKNDSDSDNDGIPDAKGKDTDNDGIDDDSDFDGLMNPTKDSPGDVKMEELLCDLLQALGVPMPDDSNENEFKRHLYEAAMSKIKELAGKAQVPSPSMVPPNQQKPGQPQKKPGQPPANPLIQQEQQPMYMSQETIMPKLSLEDINKVEDSTTRALLMAMYTDNEQLRASLSVNEQKTNALRDAELAKETKKRQTRIQMLSRLSPKVKDDLEQMVGSQSMSLSMGDTGAIVDPMKPMLDMLEKGLANLPRLLTTDAAMLSVQPHPTDADQLSTEGEAKLVEDMSRMMGCGSEKKAS